MTKSNSSNFTEGKILSPLLNFAMPILFALLLQAMYGAVDLLVVGKFASSADVSGVATGSKILMTLTTFITSLAMGTTVVLGQRIGEKKEQDAGATVGASIALFLSLGFVIAFAMQPLASPAASLMQAPTEAFSQTVDYIRICSGGAVFIVAYNLIGSIFRGIGNARMPLISVAIACAANIAGDLLLVAVFHMGAAGAAYATVFAQALSVVISMLIIRKTKLPFEFGLRMIRFDKRIIRRVLFLGIPLALQDLLVSVSFLVIMAIVNTFGVTASAGVGVAGKAIDFIMLVPASFEQAMAAFVAQNAGAGKYDRARRALKYGIMASFCFGLLMFSLSFFRGDLLAGIFSNNEEVIAAAWDYMKAYGIDCLLTAFLFCFLGYYNGLGRTRFVMIQGIASAFGIRIPVSFLMSRILPVSLFRIGLATPCASAVQILCCFIYFAHVKKEQEHKNVPGYATMKKS